MGIMMVCIWRTAMVIGIFAAHVVATDGPAAQPSTQPATQPSGRPTVSVRIDNFVFKPKKIEIAVGTTVMWQNGDDVPHTASSKDDPQTFDSGT